MARSSADEGQQVMLQNDLLLMGSSGASSWAASIGGASNDDQGLGVAVDSSGNAYVVGWTRSQGAGSRDVFLAKYNKDGVIQWQKALGGSGSDYGYAVAVDSSSNVYVAGTVTNPSTGATPGLIAKYNSSGSLQWQTYFSRSIYQVELRGIAVDSSGNVYVTGNSPTSPAGLLVAKFNTSGVLQWQKALGDYVNITGYGIAVDSSGNVYATAHSDPNQTGYRDVLTAKFNTSGTLQWQRNFGGSNVDFGNGIALDSSANVYVCGVTQSQGSGSAEILLIKYNSSGTIQWQRALGGSGAEYGQAVAVDSSENVYVTGYSSSINAVLIAKYNSSGTLQWQRSIKTSSGEYGYGIAVDNAGGVFVAGITNANSENAILIKLKDDGSGTGTYGSWTYSTTSYTSTTTTMTDSAASFTNSTTSLTDSASSLTDTSTTLTSTVTSL